MLFDTVQQPHRLHDLQRYLVAGQDASNDYLNQLLPQVQGGPLATGGIGPHDARDFLAAAPYRSASAVR